MSKLNFGERVDLDNLGPIELAKMLRENKHLQESIIDELLRRLMDILILIPNLQSAVYFIKNMLKTKKYMSYLYGIQLVMNVIIL